MAMWKLKGGSDIATGEIRLGGSLRSAKGQDTEKNLYSHLQFRGKCDKVSCVNACWPARCPAGGDHHRAA